ncbi:hypothetical protein [Spirillospora sp. NPDC029432]|uniref:hypothetical protein n=1 Tax=Spirillospora sp. NPDC029432 TaxID=3154599 RepID=UPI0034547238
MSRTAPFRAARAARAVAATLALTFLLTCLALPQAAPPASACHVSYAYRPDIKIDSRGGGLRLGGGDACSTRHSLVGVTVVALAALGILGVAGARAFRKGRAAAGGRQQADRALASYIGAAGESPAGPSGQGDSSAR